MSVLKGCGVTFLLGTNVVAELNNVSNPINADSLDVTTFDSGCVREFIAGLRSGTMDISGFYDPSDTNGQKAMLTAMVAGTLLTGAQLPKVLWNATNGLSADGVITSLTIDAAVDGIVSFSASIQLSGEITVI